MTKGTDRLVNQGKAMITHPGTISAKSRRKINVVTKLTHKADELKIVHVTLEKLREFQTIPLMHDAQTTMKKFVADGGTAHEIHNQVIVDRGILSNLYADVQVLKLNQAADEETRKEFDVMKEDIDGIAVFLREQFAHEISMGYHANRNLATIVVGYLQDYLTIRGKKQ
jgi:hypothetical protein